MRQPLTRHLASTQDTTEAKPGPKAPQSSGEQPGRNSASWKIWKRPASSALQEGYLEKAAPGFETDPAEHILSYSKSLMLGPVSQSQRPLGMW